MRCEQNRETSKTNSPRQLYVSQAIDSSRQVPIVEWHNTRIQVCSAIRAWLISCTESPLANHLMNIKAANHLILRRNQHTLCLPKNTVPFNQKETRKRIVSMNCTILNDTLLSPAVVLLASLLFLPCRLSQKLWIGSHTGGVTKHFWEMVLLISLQRNPYPTFLGSA